MTNVEILLTKLQSLPNREARLKMLYIWVKSGYIKQKEFLQIMSKLEVV